MAAITYNLNLLEDFRMATHAEAGHVGSLGDGIRMSCVSSTIFGRGPGAGGMAGAVDEVDAHSKQEFEKAEGLLNHVSRSIDAVHDAIAEAEKTGKRTFDSGSSQLGAGGGGGYSGSTSGGGGDYSGGGGGTGDPGSGGHGNANPDHGDAPPVDPGHGVKINLPDGLGTSEAPNEKAAEAVRRALSQLGVDYVWGGESPGHGFDCSGLTQWAYGAEGVDLPHDAAAQNVGEQVSRKNLAPGDLVVWDGHVAMYIGHDKVIEAPHTGDVVHIVPLTTSNAGDRFEGFWRPTAKG